MQYIFHRFNRIWRTSFILQFATLALLIFGSRSVIADWNYVPSGSMKPTILEGDAVFVNRMAYDLRIPFTRTSLWHRSDPQRGQVVIFFSPSDEQRLVKRIVALPGDEVAMFAGQLYVNRHVLSYRPLRLDAYTHLSTDEQKDHFFAEERLGEYPHPVMQSRIPNRQGDFPPQTVPTGYYFVMGDHRDNSADSRYFGFVSRDRIVGQAVGVLASFDQDNDYRPRWQRFFTSMP